MKIPRRLQALFGRKSYTPTMNVESISATINRALDQAGLRKFTLLRPTVEPVKSPQAATNAPDTVAGSFLSRTYSSASGSCDYKVFVPSTYSAEREPRPGMIVMLHGCHQSADDTAAGTRMNMLAEQDGFLVAYPQQAPRSNGNKCWNWFRPEDQERDRGEPALIAGITTTLRDEFKIDPQRIFVAGMSAGGAMAIVMASNYPEIYSAVGVHSGLPFRAAHDVPSAFAVMRQGEMVHERSEKTATRPVPAIIFHGDGDQTVNPRNADDIVARILAMRGNDEPHTVLTSSGDMNGRRYTRTMYSGLSDSRFLETWIVHGGGHEWSGGSTDGSYTNASGPDASAEMVRFFALHESGKH